MSIATAIKTIGTAGDSWGTPQDLFDEICKKYFIGLVFDPCPNPERFLIGSTIHGNDGLKDEWIFENIFVNPPFSDIAPWVEKSYLQNGKKIVMLLPARTDQAWYHDFAPHGKIILIRGRVNYVDINSEKKSCASFASILLLFGFGVGIDFWRPNCHKNRKKR